MGDGPGPGPEEEHATAPSPSPMRSGRWTHAARVTHRSEREREQAPGPNVAGAEVLLASREPEPSIRRGGRLRGCRRPRPRQRRLRQVSALRPRTTPGPALCRLPAAKGPERAQDCTAPRPREPTRIRVRNGGRRWVRRVLVWQHFGDRFQ